MIISHIAAFLQYICTFRVAYCTTRLARAGFERSDVICISCSHVGSIDSTVR